MQAPAAGSQHVREKRCGFPAAPAPFAERQVQHMKTMRTIIAFMLLGVLTLGACSLNALAAKACAADAGWIYTEDYHWRETDKGFEDMGEHDFRSAECTVCGYTLAVTEGLIFELNEAGDGYILIGIGEVKDSIIVVPGACNNLPVRAVGDKAFWLCSTVEKIVLPEGIEKIGEYAFADCNNLTSVYIPEGVSSIGYMALMDCTSLPEVTLPSTIKEIGGSLIFYSRRMKDLNFAGTVAQWEAVSKDGWNNGVTVSVVHCLDGDVPAR